MARAETVRNIEGRRMMPAIVPTLAGDPRCGGACLAGCRVSNGFGANDADGPHLLFR
jgi:hypothetical protein